MGVYFVTGAAGFIASRVSEQLLEDGHIVIGIDNMNDAYDVRLKQWRLERLQKNPAFIFYPDTICDRKVLDHLADNHGPFDAIVNLAARAGVRQSVEDPWAFVDSNTTGTLNLLELCRRGASKKFLLASTSSIYGANAPLPTTEEADSSHPLQPYAASKKAAEVMAYSYHYLYGVDVSVVRYFTVYGPAGRPDLAMFRFVQWVAEGRTVRVNGDGNQTRGFTYIDDIARGTIQALKPLGYEIINLGGHQTISINDLITMVEELVGKEAKVEHLERHPADMQANWANVEKARRLLGWEPQVTLEKGVPRLVDWYFQERSWVSQIITD